MASETMASRNAAACVGGAAIAPRFESHTAPIAPRFESHTAPKAPRFESHTAPIAPRFESRGAYASGLRKRVRHERELFSQQ